ncbi:uncharacterized protein LOC116127665 [Pistacia vera]|uniref:uncharacterized protein LOC116127665 n=1 Tax=Pistacia vera TaxID=55513 RepID=UPI001263D182|nr:uncharacterized protein LOC116127665 [Pistacia vera]
MVETVVSVVVEVGKWLAAPIGRQFMYLYNYKSNFDDLKNEVEKLKEAEEEVTDRVVAAERNVEKIKYRVKEWQKNVDSIIVQADNLIAEKENDRCFKGFCPNLITRYKYGKKAFKMKEDNIFPLLQQQKDFDKVSNPTILDDVRLKPDKNYTEMASRNSILSDIVNALNDANVNMIGIYGMGGIGKTTIAKEVAIRVKKFFDVVVFVEVTEAPDVKKIQTEMADQLRLQFNNETEKISKLYERLKKKEEKNDGKILIILDNLWDDNFDLKSIGIPDQSDDRGCKLLVTARYQHVLKNMGDPKPFPIGNLSEEESWRLFKNMAGDFIEKHEFKSLAENICSICKGLPIAIVTIARALRHKNQPSQWKTALRTLKRSSPENITGEMKEAYATIDLSYKYLKDLVKYVVGLDIFQDIYTIEEARDKVSDLIYDLKDSCLLFTGHTNESFSMHDFVREVALSIANRDDHVFSVRNEITWSWPPQNCLKICKKIFVCDSSISELHNGLDCPELESFFMSTKIGDSHVEIPENFFTKMTKLKVLDLVRVQFFSLQSSLQFLVNLQTLCLDYCKLEDVAIIGVLNELKILSLRGSNVEHLPKEIGRLTQLRLLDLSHCRKLNFIAPNVLSSLVKLEELYMNGCSVVWEAEASNVERSNASLGELKYLSHLTTLELHIKDEKMIPKGLFTTQKLERYEISIGDGSSTFGRSHIERDDGRFMRILSFSFDEPWTSSRMLKLKLTSIIWSEELQGFRNVEFLCIDKLKQGIKNVLYELDKEGFSKLKHLHVHNNPNILCLVDSIKCVPHDAFPAFPLLESLILFNLIELRRICYGQPIVGSFCNLKIVEVRSCTKLENIFSFSNSRSLPQLQRINVSDCKNMKAAFIVEREDDVNINEVICQLRFLTLMNLPRIANFYLEVKTPSTSQSSQESTTDLQYNDVNLAHELDTPSPLFNEKVVFPNLEALELQDLNSKVIWDNKLPTMSSCYQSLTRLIIGNLGKLKYVFPSSMVKNFEQLQHLEIRNCKELNEIIAKEEGAEAAATFMFPKIESLYLRNLSELTTFYSGIHTSTWPLLKNLVVSDCRKLHIFTSEYKVVFPNLEDVRLQAINSQMIWDSQLPPMSDCYQHLTRLIIKDIGKLKYVFPSSMVKNFEQLQHLEISNCDELKEIIAKEGGVEAPPTFIFPRVEFLQFGNLPKLTTFYPGIHSSEWPKLKKLQVYSCDKLHIFTSQFKIVFSNLEALDLHGIHTEMIWDHLIRNTSSCYQNLTRLILAGCAKLIYVFPSSVIKSFERLRHIEISSCKELIEIVTKEEGAEAIATFTFPQVTFLKLNDLPELRGLCLGQHTSEWPMLKELEVYKCDKLQLLTSDYEFNVDWEELLMRSDNMMTWQCLFPEHFSFKGTIEIKGDKSTNFLLDILQRSIHIEKLILSESLYEEIFSCGEKDKHAGTLMQIKNLKLSQLSKLKCTWKQDSKLDFILQNLGVLEVTDCDRLISLLPSHASFASLTVLRVDWCWGLTNLFVPSTAKSLMQLMEMKIENCKLITEIISKEDDEDLRVEDEIVFNKLKLLSLENLESLTCFCFGYYNFELPVLEELIVKKCPNMKTFSEAVVSAPSLRKVKFIQDNNEEGCWQGDLNTTIQHLRKIKVNSNFEKLVLSGKDLMPVWQDPLPEHHQFCQVKVLEVIRDESAHIPIEVLQRFKNLKKLILKVSSYQEIFSCEEAEKHVGMLTQIKELELWGLFDLKYMWKQDSHLDSILQNLEMLDVNFCHNLINLAPSSATFENLTTLDVWQCHGLINLVSSSTAKSLVGLETMSISRCEMMIEVVSNEGDKKNDEIVFENLNSLTLHDLESLTSFCSGNYTFKFPTLEKLVMDKCPKMKTFSEGVLSVPSLQKVMQDWDDEEGYWEGDLNTTIQHRHKNLNIQISEKDSGQTSMKSPE